MKISLNWLRKYIEINVDPDELSEILTSLGLEVEGVEEYESIKGGLKGVLIGQVMECQKHPNADKLSLTKVDIGGDRLLQIVCGAPNVEAGQKVAVATIGTTLYPVDEEPWVIKKGKIRGEFSEGMICAEDELGIGSDHTGIMVLNEDAQVGMPGDAYFKVEKDIVYDIALTPNRSDATSHIGVANDLAAYFKVNSGQSGLMHLPDISDFQVDSQENEIQVIVEDTEGCPRYSGISLRNVTIKESPDWLKNRLNSIGVRPINNIVDITNYVLHEIGQPLHAFDANKIKDNKIIVKSLPKGSIFKSLDEQERKLEADDLMICNGLGEGMCIAGVFGGIESGVTERTKDIFLEAAHFNAKRIRKTSMHHLLRTDAANIFEKGSDPNVTVYALKRAATMMKELAGAQISSDIIDIYPEKIEKKEIVVSYAAINRLIGIEIPKDQVHEILNALEIDIVNVTEENILVKIPTNKTEVTRPADVIEEILRIYGFNNIPVSDKINTNVNYGGPYELHKIRRRISDFLTSRGWYEMMNLSLIPSKFYREIMPDYEKYLVSINNTSNVNLDVMRPEMMVPVLSTLSYNQNRQQENARVFEFGNIYRMRDGGSHQESEILALCIKGKLQHASWLVNSETDPSFYDIKREVAALLKRFGNITFHHEEIQDDGRFLYGLKSIDKGKELARFGVVNSTLNNYFDVRGPIFYAEIYVSKFVESIAASKIEFKEINKYPSTKRDLAMVLEDDIPFSRIEQITAKIDKTLIKQIQLFDVYKNPSQLGENRKSYAVSFVFESYEKTLKDKEVDKVMNKLIHKLEEELSAKIRQ